MRWFWIDRFIEFESGRSAKAVKNVSLAEEQISDHFSGTPIMPASLVIEGLAQTGGMLVAEARHFDERVVLAKVSKIRFHFDAVPGDTLIYSTTLEDLSRDGGIIAATSHVGDRLQAEGQLFFAHLTEPAEPPDMWEPTEFATLVRLLRLYDVGRNPDGSPIEIPPRFLEAERQAGM